METTKEDTTTILDLFRLNAQCEFFGIVIGGPNLVQYQFPKFVQKHINAAILLLDFKEKVPDAVEKLCLVRIDWDSTLWARQYVNEPLTQIEIRADNIDPQKLIGMIHRSRDILECLGAALLVINHDKDKPLRDSWYETGGGLDKRIKIIDEVFFSLC